MKIPSAIIQITKIILIGSLLYARAITIAALCLWAVVILFSLLFEVFGIPAI